jgi:phenylacetate-coenzyme A ligase PaaK-like adenylate-forming protein
MRVVWDTMYTTGTSTGTPTPFVSTAYDYYAVIAMYRRILTMRGVRGDDLIANLCPLTVYPHGAFHRVSAGAAAMKIPVVHLLPGRPSPHFHLGSELDEVVEGIERTRATILWGVTSYVRRVLLRAAELGSDFSRVRLAYITGEPVTQALRDNFAQCLRAARAHDASVNVSYGITEIQGGFNECAPGGGFHNPMPEDIHVDIVDPQTHRPLPEGERGLVVISHLNRRGTLLLRYATGDLSVLSRVTCPHCGASTDRLIETPQRADALVKIKGMLVNPAVLETAVLAVAGIEECQAFVERESPTDPFSMDRLLVRITGAADDRHILEQGVSRAVKEAIGVTPQVEWVEAAMIFGPGGTLKLKRFVDRRGAPVRATPSSR